VRGRRLPAALLLAVAAAACAAPAPSVQAAPPSLQGTRWIAAGARKDDASAARLEFTREGRVAGFTGCNMLGGSYRLEEDRLDVVAATTKRACPGPGGEMEDRLLAVLGDRPRVRIEGRSLVLTGAKGSTVEFVAAQAP
jgi:heat shock protein HslJ